MKVTAVVVAYQSREFIDACLRALRESHQAGVLECVVVDNASTDSTADHVETNHPWVQVVRNSRNLGYARGCNIGLDRAASEYVLFMNPDAVIRLEALRELVQFLEGRSEAGIAAPATIIGANEYQEVRPLPTPQRLILAACGDRWATNSVRPITPGSKPFQAEWLCGAILLARRSLMVQLGGFDPRFFLYFEETDLCRRALDRGAELWAVGIAVAHHSGGASAAQSGECVVDGCIRHHFYRSRFYYLRKHHGWLAAIFTEMTELVVLAMSDAGRLMLGRRSQSLRLRLRVPILRSPASERKKTMNPTVIHASDLTDRQLALWSEIQRSDRTMSSPFFRPEFTQAVASVRSDVYVAELKDNGQTVGFFPFCKGRMNVGRPVGQPLCDFQGIIGRTDRSWDDVEFICRCGLAAWDFDHLLCSQAVFNSRQHRPEESPLIDMANGFEAYRQDKQSQGTNLFRDMARKARKMGREIGPLRFELNASDPTLLRTVIQWKSDQSRRAGTFDVFRWNWPQRLLESILAQRGEAFGGILSVLWAGETVAAIHMGMRSRSVLHWWFPTYNSTLAKYSPGLILFIYLLREAEEIGIKRVDLGKGDEIYKKRFMTGSQRIAVGSIEASRITRMIRRARRTSAAIVRSSPLPHSFRGAARLVRFGEKWLKYR